MPIFFLLVMILIIWLRYEIKRTSKASRMSSSEFWKREQEANYARKADLSALPYISVPKELIESLPTIDDPEYMSALGSLRDLRERRILRLTGITNTELKSLYGSANLDELTQYDEAFLSLCRILNQLGTFLLKNGHTDCAVSLLEYAVSIKSDVTETYLALAEYYISTGDQDALNSLTESTESFDELRRARLLSNIEELRSSNAL